MLFRLLLDASVRASVAAKQIGHRRRERRWCHPTQLSYHKPNEQWRQIRLSGIESLVMLTQCRGGSSNAVRQVLAEIARASMGIWRIRL